MSLLPAAFEPACFRISRERMCAYDCAEARRNVGNCMRALLRLALRNYTKYVRRSHYKSPRDSRCHIGVGIKPGECRFSRAILLDRYVGCRGRRHSHNTWTSDATYAWYDTQYANMSGSTATCISRNPIDIRDNWLRDTTTCAMCAIC